MLALAQPGDFASLRTCVSAGETLPAATWHAWHDATGIRLMDGIGATEMLHIFIAAPVEHVRPGSVGLPVPGYQAKLIDDDGVDLPPGSVGRLAIRGPTGCRYLADPRQAKYVIDGWNVTGDTFRQDEDGYFWFQARSDDMIVSSGYNIAGPEVEAAPPPPPRPSPNAPSSASPTRPAAWSSKPSSSPPPTKPQVPTSPAPYRTSSRPRSPPSNTPARSSSAPPSRRPRAASSNASASAPSSLRLQRGGLTVSTPSAWWRSRHPVRPSSERSRVGGVHVPMKSGAIETLGSLTLGTLAGPAFRYVAELEQVKGADNLATAFRAVIALVGMTNSASGVLAAGGPALARFHFVDWPESLLPLYAAETFLPIDPAARWALASMGGISTAAFPTLPCTISS